MSLCETNIVYNNITLKNVLTEDISYDPVYDKTNTDLIGMRCTITCTAYAHTETPAPGYPHGVNAVWASGTSPWSPAMTAMFRQLSMPRRRFVMTVGGSTMFDIRPTATEGEECNPTTPADENTGNNQDIAHGPKCEYRVIGIKGQTARCRFTFTFTTPLCEDASKLQDFLNLRFWIVDDVDCKTWQTTRTYQGIFRVKGMQVDSHALARRITLPPIQPGFRRERIQWSESPDHLEMTFTIVDTEQWAMAPTPATHWEGTYSISVPQGDVTAEAELRFRLWGDRDMDKRLLFILAQSIIDHKMHYQDLLAGNGQSIVLAQIWEEKLEANEISVYLKVRQVGKVKGISIWGYNVHGQGDKFELGLPLASTVTAFIQNVNIDPYDRSYVYTPEGGPTAGLAGIFICALQTPCCPQKLSDKSTEEAEDPAIPPYPEQEPIEYVEVPYEAQDCQVRYNQPHLDNPYIWYRITNQFHKDTGWRGFPMGTACTYGTSDATFAFSQIHCGICTREIRIDAARVDAWPDIPDLRDSWTDNQGIRYVLKDVDIEPSPPRLTADGKKEIREVQAKYYYYMDRPPTSQQNYMVGTLPYVEANTGPDDASAYIPPEAFKDPPMILATEELQ